MPPSDFVILQAMTEVVVLPAASTPGSTRTLQDIPDASEKEKRLLPSYVRLRVHLVDSGDIPPGFVLVCFSLPSLLVLVSFFFLKSFGRNL